MRRVAVGAVAVAMLAVPAAVARGIDVGDFGGKVDGDPDQYITFDVVKKNGKRFVTHIAELNAPFTCADPLGNGPQSGGLDGRFRIKRDGTFEGEKSYDFDARGGSTGLSYSIEGEFVKKRKVVGKYKIRLRGGPPNPCVTGKLPFVARKPAPDPPPKEN